MKEQEFYFLKDQNCIVNKIKMCNEKPPVESNDEIIKIESNSTDASTQKHIPIVKKEGNKITVTVGELSHPITEEHYIDWIYVQTEKGGQFKNLTPNDENTASFIITEDDKIVNVFAYCNLHGLWKANL